MNTNTNANSSEENIMPNIENNIENNIEKLIADVVKRGPKKIFLQAPEGLKKYLVEIANKLKKKGIVSVICGKRCYGACDMRLDDARSSGCDLYAHIGHAEFYIKTDAKIPVLYYVWPLPVSFSNWSELKKIKEKRIGLLSSVQYADNLDSVRKKLEEHGKAVIHGGYILGCYTMNSDKIKDMVDAYLFVGTGSFHVLALKGRPVYKLDLEKNIIEIIETKKTESRRQWNITQAKEASIFGILVSTKPGQRELQGHANEILEKLEKAGRDGYIIYLDEINEKSLLSFNTDAFINTACPRIVEDHFSRPIINAGDFDKIL